MAEALKIAPDGLNTPGPSFPQIVDIPFHLHRRTLQKVEQENGKIEKLWGERADKVELKVQSIVASQKNIVESARLNPKYTEGSDVEVVFVEGFAIDRLKLEVKSSTVGVGNWKQKAKNRLPKGQRDMDHLREWMTVNKIILVNGGEKFNREKTKDEILNDSFYPQLNRILRRKLFDGLTELKDKKEKNIFP